MISKIIKSSTSLATSLRVGYGQLKYTNQLKSQNRFDVIQTFRVFDFEGKLVNTNIKFDCNELVKILKTMIFVDEMDDILLKVKGQGILYHESGKISFYMTSFGEHACIVGSAAALSLDDWVYSQYRQQGAHIWRGFTIDQAINQCIGNAMDAGKGRQMPVHYGCKQINTVTISSPLTTQVPQAAGSGYAFRTANEQKIAAVYFGQGAASEGDFSTALNFAATLRSQTLFLCRNNKYAISTPTDDQYISDGVIPKAIATGIASTRVDGNDALACYEATKFARNYILQNKKPYFLQFMTYRVGDHSTSDNSALYRSQDERKQWTQNNDPIRRLIKFLKNANCADIPDQKQQRKKASKQIRQSLHRCQKHKFLHPQTLFDDVYDQLTTNLKQQKQQLKQHLKQYSDKYEFLQK